MFIQAVVYDRNFSVFRSEIIGGFDLCWDYRIQWWRSQTLAGIKEKVKVRTKYTLTSYSLEIAPMSDCDCLGDGDNPSYVKQHYRTLHCPKSLSSEPLYKLTGTDRQAGRRTDGQTNLGIGRHAPPKMYFKV